jgi:oligopeptide/dipeptide ABC transporter ATP-binding protein
VLAAPAHPYTRALVAANPVADPAQRAEREALRARVRAGGERGDAAALPTGCRFHPRCPAARERCAQDDPALRPLGPERAAACHYAEPAGA